MDLAGFVGPSYISQSTWADQEDLINWYPEPIESQAGSTRAALYPTPGVEMLVDTGIGPGSAHFSQAGREFAIIGTMFYEIGQYGSLTSLGTVAIDSNPGTISSNGDGGGELFITSGGNGYVFNLSTSAFAAVAALAGIATMGDQLDGFFLCLDASTSTVFLSDQLDGTTWDPTQAFQRSIAPDPWVSMKVANRYIYLFGSETSEIWYDDGSFPIPFVPHPSGLLQLGCSAPFSPEVLGSSVVWLSKTVNGSGGVAKVDGFTPEQISNYATETAFAGYTLSDAIGDTYEEFGHNFYLVTFPSSDITWCYDGATRSWHKRLTWITETGEFSALSVLYHAFAFNQHRMLDRNSGKVYLMDNAYGFDVDGRAIRRVRRSPALFMENKRVLISSFELDMEVGLGLQTGQGSDPQVMFRYSNDGGKTWSNELTASAGRAGEYGVRVKWNRLGMARRRVFEISVSDPIPWRLLAAYVETSPSADIQGGQGQAA